MGFLENTLAFVFVLGVMVLVHELGHYLAAVHFNVRVESFSIGFGPRLFGFKRGETDWKVCLLPLGGYVKMAGENIGEPTGDPDEFLSKPRWQRLIIAFMGPLFNILLAIALPVGLYMAHYERLAFQTEPPVIGYVESGSSADEAGLRPGDRIVSIDGEPTPTWESVMLIEVAAVHETVDVVVERDGRRLEFLVPIEETEISGIGRAGWSESSRVRLGPTVSGMPAHEAGIQEGDLLLAVNGEKIDSVSEVVELIQQSAGSPMELKIERDGRVMPLTVAAVRDSTGGAEEAWRIGVSLSPDYERIRTQLSFVDALGQSLDDNRKNATLIFGFLKGLVEQRMSPRSLEGPIGIARLSGRAARTGWPQLILLMAAISLNLGIFNLLPIPILDGGVITLLLIESVMQRDISVTVKERITQAGLVFIMLLFAFVMYNDIIKSLASS